MTAERRPRLFLLDGLALAYRSHFAFIRRPLTNARGENTSAVFAFANTVIKLRDGEKPDYWALAWEDTTEETRRHTSYGDYKANRPPMPDDLVAQLPRILEVAAGLGLPRIQVAGTEADDVMATLARRAVADGMDVVLVTNDKDLQQLVGPHITVLAPGGGPKEDAWLDEAAVRARWGVPPVGLRDVLALMGDSVDNVPGVPGVGEKTAVELVAAFGSLDGIYEHLSEVKREAVRKRLAEHRASAYLSRDLVTLDDDLEIAEPWEDLLVGPVDPVRLRALAAALDLNRLARYAEQAETGQPLRPLAPSAPAAPPPVEGPPGEEPLPEPAEEAAGAPAEPPAGAGQLGFGFDVPTVAAVAEAQAAVAPPLVWQSGALPPAYGPKVRIVTTAGELAALAEQLRAAPTGFAVDTETTAEDPLQARLVGIGFAWGEAPVYVPLAHREGGNAPRDAFERALAPVLADPAIPKLGQHYKYDQLVLRGEGLPLAGLACDTMIASYLLDPETPHNLDWLAANHLGVVKIPTTALIGRRGRGQLTMDQVPIEVVAAYCGEDVHVTWELAARFVPQLVAQGQAPLFRDVEIPLSDVLADMEWEGVALDVPFLATMSARLAGEIEALEKRIHGSAGMTFNIQSTQQLGEILFKKLALPGGRKTKTGWSTDSDVLEGMAELHELPRLVLQYRQLTKLKGTYVDALPALVLPRDGRLHTSFHQTVAATGRLSSSDPNLQNIPFRTPLGREVRRAFVARPGWRLLSADYSQVELRIMAHLSRDPVLVEAFERGEDVHAGTARRVFGLAPGQPAAPEQRAMAKVVNFGVMYGMGARALAQQLGIPVPEATRFIAEYFRTHQGVDRFLKQMVADARARGYSETILGRRRRLPALTAGAEGRARSDAERAAINTPIQGSAADLIKVAMIKLARDLQARGLEAKLVLQVHDELLVEAPEAEVETARVAVEQAMTTAMALSVPLEVQTGVGLSWLEVHA
jgi:DNA polymerase-1